MLALERVRQWACTLKRDVLALYLAARDPRVPWYAKAVAACVAVYALSPIDLIPDVIPSSATWTTCSSCRWGFGWPSV
jgi:uncharacterized membrane protein YkvA (DUF1232 family)